MTPEEVLTQEAYVKLKSLANQVDQIVSTFHFPMKWCLVAWPFGQIDRANKVTNCANEQEVIRALDEIARRMDEHGPLILPPHF
jgi:hypothetical protein